MTTTGSARYHNVLKDIGPRIVIVEEAAEVLESHIITSLSKHTEHLILIGDHHQLKPKNNVYELERNYNMNISLFERLINNKFDYVTLSRQHRMRPEISCLMKHFYETKIEDHESVLKREHILGVKQDIAFINHSILEDNLGDDENRSKVNKYEGRYLVKLAKFFIRQHYETSQITILATYSGQTTFIQHELKRENVKGIRVCTVDNFQGEESHIILLSLVRSNLVKSIGFLSTENRVCVAFSRARDGFFCIGNFNLLKDSKSKSNWKAIIKDMKEKNYIHNGLHLSCGHHPQNDLLATKPEDFDKRPEGGCLLNCDFYLKCGHRCPRSSHLFDLEPKNIKCIQFCKKTIGMRA